MMQNRNKKAYKESVSCQLLPISYLLVILSSRLALILNLSLA